MGYIIALIVIAVLVAIACCKVSGDCARQEEREALQLRLCPQCRRVPRLGYCCGEYFVAGEDPDCPCCGTAFTEMHSTPKLEVDAWNRRAKEWVD